jgi:hypothetical protein
MTGSRSSQKTFTKRDPHAGAMIIIASVILYAGIVALLLFWLL